MAKWPLKKIAQIILYIITDRREEGRERKREGRKEKERERGGEKEAIFSHHFLCIYTPHQAS